MSQLFSNFSGSEAFTITQIIETAVDEVVYRSGSFSFLCKQMPAKMHLGKYFQELNTKCYLFIQQKCFHATSRKGPGTRNTEYRIKTKTSLFTKQFLPLNLT